MTAPAWAQGIESRLVNLGSDVAAASAAAAAALSAKYIDIAVALSGFGYPPDGILGGMTEALNGKLVVALGMDWTCTVDFVQTAAQPVPSDCRFQLSDHTWGLAQFVTGTPQIPGYSPGHAYFNGCALMNPETSLSAAMEFLDGAGDLLPATTWTAGAGTVRLHYLEIG